jgi:hypothetical protein
MDMLKLWFSVAATVISLIAFLPYIRATLRQRIQPHCLSWTIWGMTTSIVFFAQLQTGAGVGAWPVGFSALIAFAIAAIALIKRGNLVITPLDWVFFGLALSAIPLWHFADSPMLAVILVTIIDVFGFGPTLRKAHQWPDSESVQFFGFIVVRNILVLLALEHYSLTTMLFPLAIGTMALVVMVVVLLGRAREKART